MRLLGRVGASSAHHRIRPSSSQYGCCCGFNAVANAVLPTAGAGWRCWLQVRAPARLKEKRKNAAVAALNGAAAAAAAAGAGGGKGANRGGAGAGAAPQGQALQQQPARPRPGPVAVSSVAVIRRPVVLAPAAPPVRPGAAIAARLGLGGGEAPAAIPGWEDDEKAAAAAQVGWNVYYIDRALAWGHGQAGWKGLNWRPRL